MKTICMNYLEGLNEVQKSAVMCVEGPSMVIAGPGSGKTRVLTHRIAYLIDEMKIDPFRILALTFTNKAAKEMRKRIESMIGNEANNLWMGTFHSVFARILRYEAHRIGYDSNFTIYDTTDSRSLIRTIIKEMQLDDKFYKPSGVQYRISLLKNDLMLPDAYRNNINLMNEDEISGRKRFVEVYENYVKRCFQSGAMDFDDLLLKMNELLDKHPEVLYNYQNKFKYLLVDEYQDTNYAQYKIVKRLAAIHEQISVVGDDAQSIYSFRGANISNILNFQNDFADAQVFKLEQNYRSTKKIVKAANAIISNNTIGLKKEIWTDNVEGDNIKVFKAPSDNDEGRIVADKIFDLKHREHYLNSDFVILYRTNAQSRAFEESLRKLNIPYRVYGGTAFYQRKEIKDLLAYLKLTVNHYDEEALRRVINFPTRGIGQTTLDKLTLIANQSDLRLWDVVKNIQMHQFPPRTRTAIENFAVMIQSFKSMLDKTTAFDLTEHIGKSSGLLKHFNEDKSVEGISRFDNIQELLNGIKEFTEKDVVDENAENEETLSDKSLATYLQEITLLTDMDMENMDDNHVRLMTAHAAKGLEFPAVFVVGLEESLFPSMMAGQAREDMEEERRLFYVAVTRAEKHLSLSYATSRYRYGRLEYPQKSRFLDEVPDDILDLPVTKRQQTEHTETQASNGNVTKTRKTFIKKILKAPDPNFKADDPSTLTVGMEVEHQRFGLGKIQTIDGDPNSKVATIFFKEHGQKRIMLKFAKLRIFNRDLIDE